MADGESGTGGTQVQDQQTTTTTTATEAPQRPEFVPEKFWDPQSGVRVEQLAKSYGELERGRNTVRETVKAEIDAERTKARPESPDKYSFAVPTEGPVAEAIKASNVVLLTEKPAEGFQPEQGKTYFLVDHQDPLLGWWRKTAFDASMSQDQFLEGVALFASQQGARAPTEDEQKQALASEYAKLGENGAQRADHVWNGLKARLGEDTAKALDGAVSSAEGIQALEMLLEKAGEPRFADGGRSAGSGGLTIERLKAIQAEPDYWQNPEKQKVVADGYQRLYPGQNNRMTNYGPGR